MAGPVAIAIGDARLYGLAVLAVKSGGRVKYRTAAHLVMLGGA